MANRPSSPGQIEKTINIKAFVNRSTGLVMARADDYKAHIVFGDNFLEVESKLPQAIRDHSDMLGFGVEKITLVDLEEESEFRSIPASLIAQALLFEKGSRDSC